MNITSLLQYRLNHTSQFGEDGILQRIFEVIGTNTKFCVEVGASDGKDMSNTLLLRERSNWSAVLIEASETDYERLQVQCGAVPNHWLLHERISKTAPIDQVLNKTPIPKNFDLFSLDIDGNEYGIWSQMTEYRARVVIVEFNPSFGPYVLFVQSPEANSIGSSLQSIAQLGAALDYELVCVTDVNCIFVDRTEAKRLNLPPRTPQQFFYELWSSGDCPWMPVTISDYNGNHYLIRPGGWNGGQCISLVPGQELDQFRDHSPVLPVRR